ncbi:hypothetical protein C8J40_10244 [Sphingomonas sp. PP-CC-3A-396]|nr:hypothetical protein C8J40_10244 [Sphingomonas sp. PP-CC-3A-396]
MPLSRARYPSVWLRQPPPLKGEESNRKRNRARHLPATGPTKLPRGGSRQLSRGMRDYGSITVSMTWITPFDCMTLAIVTRPLWPLPSMMPQPAPDFMNISGSPCTVV